MKTFQKIVFIFFVLLVACFPDTKLTRTWVDPSYTPGATKPFKKILVIAKMKDEPTRKMAEDKIVSQFVSAGTTVPSYSYFGGSDTAIVQMQEKLTKDTFDCVLRMNLVKVDTSLMYRPDPALGGYGAGWHRGYGSPYPGTPGYFAKNETFFIETNIYSIETSKLIWSGTTTTFEPGSLIQVINETIDVIKDELLKKGIFTDNIKKG